MALQRWDYEDPPAAYGGYGAPTPRGGGGARLLGRIFALVLILAAVFLAAPFVIHLTHGAVSDAVGAVAVDYRAAAACPDRAQDLWRFVNREDVDLPVDSAREALCTGGAFARGRSADTLPRETEVPIVGGAAPTAAARERTPAPVAPALAELRRYMLDLINEDRAASGLNPVRLGTNSAAQRHAEEMFEHEYLAHWGRDGLKPYMRYTLAGGEGYASENVSGQACPRTPDVRYVEADAKESIREAQEGLMNSPGHRRNILDKWHTKVNLGIACDGVGCSIAQLFEGDYVDFWEEPNLFLGKLTMLGQLSGGFELSSVQVWYEEPPHPLTFGQLGRTRSYNLGQRPAAFVRPPAPPNQYYPSDDSRFSWESGTDPYLVPPNAPRPPRIVVEGTEDCDIPLPSSSLNSASIPWVTAATWGVDGDLFRVEADLSDVVQALGPGVYTIVVWGESHGEPVGLTNYSIFVD